MYGAPKKKSEGSWGGEVEEDERAMRQDGGEGCGGEGVRNGSGT